MNENYLKRWGTISSVLCLAIIFLVNDFYFYNNRAFKENKFLFDENTINLGLDLRGGSEFILSPRIDKWIINNHQANISDGKNLATAIDDLKKSNDLFTLENFFILTGSGATALNIPEYFLSLIEFNIKLQRSSI